MHKGIYALQGSVVRKNIKTTKQTAKDVTPVQAYNYL